LTRNLQLYTLGDRQYTVSDFDRGLDVTTYAAVSRPRHTDAVVGIIGARRPNSTLISIWRVVDCARFELLVESEAEFAWRTPMQRIDDTGTQPVPKRGGVRIVGAIDEDESRLTFLHYDGYDLRIFSVVEQQDGWHVVESKQALYAERTDLSFD
jgi:hypothetical protein